MNCYICDQATVTATLRYGVAPAIGICHDCGIGVCARHSHKEAEPGSPLLCVQCASLRNGVPVVEAANASLEKSNA